MEEVKKISLDDFLLKETIGTGKLIIKIISIYIIITNSLFLGSFGRVRISKHKKTNKIYAIKMLKKIEIIRSKQIDHIHSEYNILRQINHPFIVYFSLLN